MLMFETDSTRYSAVKLVIKGWKQLEYLCGRIVWAIEMVENTWIHTSLPEALPYFLKWGGPQIFQVTSYYKLKVVSFHNESHNFEGPPFLLWKLPHVLLGRPHV